MSDESSSPSPREHLSALLSLAPRAIRAVWIGGIALAIGLGGTVAWTLSTAHLYRSEAVIAFEHGVRTGTLSGEHDSPREISARLRDMLFSRQRLERVIEELNLYRRIAEHQGQGAAIDEMRKHLNISGREEYAYRVSYDANGRELAQRVLETLIKGVIDEDGQRRVREAEDTKRFLDVERKHADEELKARETALAGFLAKHPSLATETGGGSAATGGLIRAAGRASPSGSGEIATLELQAAQLEESLAAAGIRVPPAPGNPNPGDPALVGARVRALAEVQTAQRDLIEKQAHFTNEHPDVKAALRHVAVAEAALRRADAALEADRANKPSEKLPDTPATGGENDPQATGKTAALKHALSAVRSQIAAVKSRASTRVEVPEQVSSVVAIDTEWTRLNRDVSEARDRQVQLEGKQFQAELMATLAGGGQGGRLVVIDPPFRPVMPITGGRFKIAAVGLAISVMLSVLTIILFAAFDDRLYGERDVNRIVKDGIVVVIPKLTGKSG
ncbi:MAG TPA: hypothetical protein VFH68_04305 [Polyangia bacterium]|jgi:uncharacterized protein involved in exopolysaccharide biosynthesis|nr:hypothetical protein [Polyangia bacterium]